MIVYVVLDRHYMIQSVHQSRAGAERARRREVDLDFDIRVRNLPGNISEAQLRESLESRWFIREYEVKS